MAKDVEVKFTVTGVDGSIKDLADLVKALNKTEEATEDLNKEQKKGAEDGGALQDRLNGIKDTYKSMVGSLKFAAKGIKTFFTSGTTGAKLFKVALAATGIPLLIGAVLALINYFKNFEVVVRTISKATNALGSVVSNVGKAFQALRNRNFKEAFTTIKDGITEAIEETDKLYDSQKRLADIQKRNIVENAKTRQEIEKFKKVLEDTTLSEEKRLAALDEVTSRTKQLAEAQLEENQAQIDGLEAKIKLENNEIARRDLEIELSGLRAERIQQQTELNNIEYDAEKVAREITQAEKDRKQAIADRAEADRIAAEEKATADKKQAELDKAAADAKAAEDAQKKIDDATFVSEQLENLKIQEVKDTFKKAQAELEIERRKNREELVDRGATLEQLAEFDARYVTKKKALDKAAKDFAIDAAKAEQQAKLQVAGDAFTLIASLSAEGSAQQKAAAMAATAIATFQGAQSAFAETKGGIAIKSIAAGIAVATGLANIRKIAQTEIPGGAAVSTPSISAPTFSGTAAAGNLVGEFNDINTVGVDSAPQKVYVVANDVTSAQEADKKINDIARL